MCVVLVQYVQVQPGDGFGTILAKETITLDVIFQPGRADNYDFELTCKTLIDRYRTYLVIPFTFRGAGLAQW